MTLADRPDLTLADLVTADPEVMGGRRVFRGTRVPVDALFENLADGLSIDDILADFGTLDRDDVIAVLRLTSAAVAHSIAA